MRLHAQSRSILELASVAMWTPQQKVFCVLSLAELKSVTLVQRRFRREYKLRQIDDVPTYVTVKKWDRCLRETGSLVSMSGRHS
ncbi:hypothetical protein C0J52_20575, partial [Blattella germanica]